MTIDVDNTYDQLRKMEVSLQSQTHANHHYYQQILTKCDLYVSMISRYYTNARQECSKLQVEHNILSEEIEAKRRHQIVENEEIQRKYSTGREREMAVEVLLKDEIKTLKTMENRLLLLKDLSGVLNTWLSVMRERKRDAKEQWKILCEQSRNANLPDPTDKGVQELNKVIGQLEATAAESGFGEDLIVNDEDIVSEEYIEGDEESDQEALQALENITSEVTVEDTDDGSFDDEIEIDPGLTGPMNDAPTDVEDDTDVTGSEIDVVEESNSEDDGESNSNADDEELDILDMLPTEDSETQEESIIEPQREPDKPTTVDESTEEAAQKEPEIEENDEMGLEDDLLEGLDEIDEGILAGIESVEKSKKTDGASKSKGATIKGGAVITNISLDPIDKQVVAEVGEPTPEDVATEDIDDSGVDNSPPKTAETEGQGQAQPEEPVRREDAASVSLDVDIDDILGELDGL